MNLLLDARVLDHTHTGIAVFTRELLPYLKDHFSRIGVLHKSEEAVSYYKDLGYEWVRCNYNLKDNMLGSILETREILKSGSWDVFFSPLFFPRVLSRSAKTKVIVMIHDLIYLDEADNPLRYFKLWLATLVGGKTADRILTVSEFSKSVIEEKFPSFKGKISVVSCPLPLRKLAGFDNSVLTRLNLAEQRYFLFVSALRKYKGYEQTIQAFGELDEPNLKLVIVGKPDLWQDRNLPQEILRLSKSERVIFTGYISDMELNSLYRNALALVFPSQKEGFGIPVLEAQYHGCPVICTEIPPLKEVAGEGCLFLKDSFPMNIQKAMVKIASDNEYKMGLIEKGRRNMGRFYPETICENIVEHLFVK
jgi:glycosyltransferase involved in cell wall biosynthesis